LSRYPAPDYMKVEKAAAKAKRRRGLGDKSEDRPVAGDPVNAKATLADRVDWLYRNAPIGLVGHVIGAIVTAGVMWGVSPRRALISWLVASLCAAIPSLAAYHLYRSSSTAADEPRTWARTYALTSCVTGTLWGMAGLVLFPAQSLGYQALLSLFLLVAGIGSVATDAVYFPAVVAFVVPCFTPLTIRLALEATDPYLWWSAGAVLITLLLLAAARSLEKLFVGALIARQAAEVAHNLAERANQEKTRFLAAASHDLRQPLTSLAINARLLGAHVPDAAGRALHESVTAAVEDLTGVLNALLDISKLDAHTVEPNIQPVAVSVVLANVHRAFEAEARAKNLTLRVRSCELFVQSNPVLLSRIVSNLVSNVVRYTPRGGVLIGCRKRTDKVSIEVWDTGVGIPHDKREEIFREFRQLGNTERDRRGGLGLGLSIARRISVLLGHGLELRSVAGKGSRFSVLAPIATANDAVTSLGHSRSWEFDPLLGATVGVIEDEAGVRRDLEALLRQWGCNVVSAESAVQLEEATGEQGALDALISDFQLCSGDNGVDAIDRLRDRFGHIPALLISGDTAPHAVRKAADMGIPILQKPFEIEALRATLCELLAAARLDDRAV
jgi:two-component system, sensor histidine kinase